MIAYYIDTFCKIIISGLAVVAVGLVIAFAIIVVGEKMKWW